MGWRSRLEPASRALFRDLAIHPVRSFYDLERLTHPGPDPLERPIDARAECPAAFADLVSGHDRLAFAFDGGAGQEKSLFADGVFHWVTVTVPPPVSGARRQFFFACASVLAPGLQSGRR